MKKYCLFTYVCAFGLLFFLTGIASAGLVIDQNYQLISKTRVGRTAYEYTYQVNINNDGADVQNVTASVTSSSPNIAIVDSDVAFGDVASGATVTSLDTFSFRLDRRYPFDQSSLTWNISGIDVVNTKLRIRDVIPSAALPGQTVIIEYTGILEGRDPLQAVLGGRTIETNSENEGKVSFEIPIGVTSSPLYLKQGDRESNTLFYDITEASLVKPTDDEIIINEDGKEVVVGLLTISLKDEFNNIDEANRIASLVGGEIVGQVPLINGYQVRIPATTQSEMELYVTAFENDHSVDFVLIDVELGADGDWSSDPGVTDQRDSNRVFEGATLYNSAMDITDSSKNLPYFVSIGIIEAGVDFDMADFSDYSAKGLSRSGNIAIYAKDSDSDHGTQVTGIMAAEIGDGDDETGKNAGLLYGIRGHHGGINISVKGNSGGKKFASSVLNSTYNIIKNGAKVINWSFGIHKKDSAYKHDGTLVDSNVFKAKVFESNKKAFEKGLKSIENSYKNVTIVATAGNGDTKIDSDYRTPSAIESDNMIVVGAHGNDDDASTVTRSFAYGHPYSNFGTRVDIAACGEVINSHGDLIHGTSFAAPLVTATVAAMQSINPHLSPKEIKELLRSSALPINNNSVTVTVKNDDGSTTTSTEVFTRPLATSEVGNSDSRVGKGARLNVEGAIQAAIDSLESDTLTKEDPVEVTLEFNHGDVVQPIEVVVPEDDVFNKVDILFLVDVSGSYGDDLSQFRSKAIDLVNAFQTAGRDVQIGLASFSDFPWSPYGGGGDYAYRLDQVLTSDSSKIISSINNLALKYGNDGPESQLEALYQAASGAGRTVANHSYSIASSTVGWRTGALPIIFLATDYNFHKEASYPGASWEEALTELTSRKIRVYGLQAGGTITDVVNIASATGGEHFTLSRDSSQIVDAVIDALDSASSSVDIKLMANGDFAGLITSISPETGFPNVTAGETVTFDVTFSRSWWRDPTADHIFVLNLEVIADDIAIIHEIPVTVHVK